MAGTPEPWLREIQLDVHPALAQALFSLQQVREDVAAHTSGLDAAQIWASPHSLAPVGFHLRHLAGSTGRLTTYLLGQELSPTQLEDMRAEKSPGPGREALLAAVEHALAQAESAIRVLDATELGAPRYIGRQRIPTTAVGLAIHIAEHAQRHTGQVVSASKLARALA